MKRSISTMSVCAAILIVLMTASCAGTARAAVSASGEMAAAEAGRGGAASADRMIVSTAYMTMDVADVDIAVKAVVDISKAHGGYVVSSGNRTVIRVEAAAIAIAMEEVARLGSVASREVQEQDVTKSYSDASLKLDNAKAARARYLELLQKAENVEAALKVEKELERLNGEITLLESQIGNLAHLTQYATITVTIRKQVTPGPLGWIFYGLYKAVEWLFVWN